MGINWNLSDETSNDLMTDQRDLPWLQDTSQVNAHAAWGASYRDVVLLDAWNRPIEPAFNLTSQDLTVEANRKDLKKRLREAAALVDLDGDRIGDDWEERFFSGLNEGVAGDPDKDGDDNLLEYSTGSIPNLNRSRTKVSMGLEILEEDQRLTVIFRRRLGAAGGLRNVLEWSATGEAWNEVGDRFELTEIENPYDGSGTEILRYVSQEPTERLGLFRVWVNFVGP